MDRVHFVKEQRETLRKALSKEAVPLKQKHAWRLIQSTFEEESCSAFWQHATLIHLEKHPLVTWKFCHLLHCLIRDGHESVLVESYGHLRRLSTLGDFWLHLFAYGGYGGFYSGNEQYCSMLCERLEFHKKYPNIPGNFAIPETVFREIRNDTGRAFEAVVDALDLMKSLLLLKRRVFDSLKIEEEQLTPQLQTLFAPLILVITDTFQLYNFLHELMIHLHAVCNPDSLWRMRTRFEETFRQTAHFYEEVSTIPYFTHHVKVPTLAAPADFELVSLTYQAARERDRVARESMLLLQPD